MLGIVVLGREVTEVVYEAFVAFLVVFLDDLGLGARERVAIGVDGLPSQMASPDLEELIAVGVGELCFAIVPIPSVPGLDERPKPRPPPERSVRRRAFVAVSQVCLRRSRDPHHESYRRGLVPLVERRRMTVMGPSPAQWGHPPPSGVSRGTARSCHEKVRVHVGEP